MRYDWNNYYAEIKRKRERIRINSKKETVKIIPSKEDSLDRLMAIGTEFVNDSEPIISRADFNQVQEEMARRSAKRSIADKLTKTEQA